MLIFCKAENFLWKNIYFRWQNQLTVFLCFFNKRFTWSSMVSYGIGAWTELLAIIYFFSIMLFSLLLLLWSCTLFHFSCFLMAFLSSLLLSCMISFSCHFSMLPDCSLLRTNLFSVIVLIITKSYCKATISEDAVTLNHMFLQTVFDLLKVMLS